MSYSDLARNLDTYADGLDGPREPDDRDAAFGAIISVVWHLAATGDLLDYHDRLEIINRLIDVADRNIDVTDPDEYNDHARLPTP